MFNRMAFQFFSGFERWSIPGKQRKLTMEPERTFTGRSSWLLGGQTGSLHLHPEWWR
jgi:hypothetical protein